MEFSSQKMERYRLFIDESGNPGTREISTSDNQRFLCLVGVAFELNNDYPEFDRELHAIKSRFFGESPENPIHLHRKELVNFAEPFDCLRDVEVQTAFNQEYLSLTKAAKYTIFAVLIDKKEHVEKYRVWLYHPYHYCLAVMLERYVAFLERENAQGDVLIEACSAKENKKLSQAYRKLYCRGTEFVSSSRFQQRLTSRELKLKTKAANSSGLQLADSLAQPLRNGMLDFSGIRKASEQDKQVFGWQLIKTVQKKIYHSSGSVFEGYGLKKLP
jgi:hypothetical protein